MSVDWQNTTFHLFCDGKTLREIAELSGFHRSTIERWSALGQWRKRREEIWTAARLRSQNESSVKYSDSLNHVSNEALDVLKLALAERQAYYKGEIPKRGLKVSGRMLVSIAKAFAALDRSIFEQMGYKVGSK
jgi:hypothetical protein